MQTIKAVLSKFFGEGRKLRVSIIGMALIVISFMVPELAPRAEAIATAIVIVVGIFSGTTTVEDSVKVWANRPKTLAEGLSMAREGLATSSSTTTSATVVTSSVTPPIKVDMTPGKEDPPPLPKIDPPSMEDIPG